jgi:predicted glutamine amidotransferase
MCRLFGFRSVIRSQVHRSLVNADNALAAQSAAHPDGWGVAYYVDGAPHVTRSASTALHDQLFHRVSGVVSSETVVAHIRKATTGVCNTLNTHPFQYGRWVFAHNGQVHEFERHQAAIEAAIAPRLRRFILGDTDTERVFYLFLTHLSQFGPLASRMSLDDVRTALSATVRQLRDLTDGEGEDERSLLTLLVTDGTIMAAVQGGKDLFWSSYKTRCSDRDECPHFAPECEAESLTGNVNHLVVSSEPLSGENVWIPLSEGQVVGVDWRMRARTFPAEAAGA